MAANVDIPRGDGLTEAEQAQLGAWEAKPGDVTEWQNGMLWGMRLRANAQDAERIRQLQGRVKEAKAKKKPKPRRKPEQPQDDEDWAAWNAFLHPEDS